MFAHDRNLHIESAREVWSSFARESSYFPTQLSSSYKQNIKSRMRLVIFKEDVIGWAKTYELMEHDPNEEVSVAAVLGPNAEDARYHVNLEKRTCEMGGKRETVLPRSRLHCRRKCSQRQTN